MVMNTKTEMSNDMTLLLQDNKEFGVFYIAIPKIIEIIDDLGLEFANMVLDNYFGYLNEEVFNLKLKVYRLSNYEFGIIVDELDKYEEFVRNISAGVSPLIKYDLYYEFFLTYMYYTYRS